MVFGSPYSIINRISLFVVGNMTVCFNMASTDDVLVNLSMVIRLIAD